jgi:4-hydroxy-tetrahydrodipicolinate reductase
MIRVIMHGLGGIGQRIARNALDRKSLEIVGATTARPEDLGKDLGDLLGMDKNLGVEVTPSLTALLEKQNADLVMDATFSWVEDIKTFLFESVRAGCNFISVCEELAYPWGNDPQLCHQIDEQAKAHSVTVLGTGINPGFFGDLIPLAFTAACKTVNQITFIRTTDAAGLGPSALDPFAIGKPLQEFETRLNAGKLKGFTGHRECIMEIADTLGWRISDIQRTIEPQVTECDRRGPFFRIEPGMVCGVNQKTVGIGENGEVLIALTLRVVFQPDEPSVAEDAAKGYKTGNFITIEGDPGLEVEVQGLSDAAGVTAIHTVNAIPYVINARPGFLSPRDFPPFVPRMQ